MAEHRGSWRAHDDDCWCGNRCNRGGHTWDCCGAAKQDSECTGGDAMHPTCPNHPKFRQTVAGYEGNRPTYVSNARIRALDPAAFVGA